MTKMMIWISQEQEQNICLQDVRLNFIIYRNLLTEVLQWILPLGAKLNVLNKDFEKKLICIFKVLTLLTPIL